MEAINRKPWEPDSNLRSLVVYLRERTNPPTSYAKIAKALNCTRQNVFKLYKKAKLEEARSNENTKWYQDPPKHTLDDF